MRVLMRLYQKHLGEYLTTYLQLAMVMRGVDCFHTPTRAHAVMAQVPTHCWRSQGELSMCHSRVCWGGREA